MDDKEAIEKTLAGAEEAFGVLASRYQSKVYAVALARVYDHRDAQDLSQETFLRAYVRLPMLRNRDAFAPWLFTILRRLCVDFMRGRWRRERVPKMMRESEELAETSKDPRQRISASDTAQTLWSHVGQLDDNSREVLSLHYGQEMKVSEIAALIGMKESAVKMRLQKARTALGGRMGDLKGVWGIAPLPGLSAGIMETITTTGRLKGVIAASSHLGGALAFPAVFSMFWWSAARDLNRWQNHAPAAMLTQGRRTIVREFLFVCAVVTAASILAALAAAAVKAPAFEHTLDFLGTFAVIFGGVYGVIMALLLGAIFKREIDLLTPREKAKQFANAGIAILAVTAVVLLPAYKLVIMGAFLVLQYVFVNKSNIALGAVPPGFWVAPLLKQAVPAEAKTVPAAKERIKPWLSILHAYGLVAPPLKNDKESFTVRLRLRGSPFEKMRCRTYSSLLVNTRGVVSCTIVPRDYVALAQHLGLDELPGRQELATRLGDSFTRALGTSAEGGDNVAVANSLGLVQCPIDTTKTYGFLLNRYVLPLIGVVLIAVFVLRRLI